MIVDSGLLFGATLYD